MSDFDRRANRNTLWSAVFVEALAGAGVRAACLSPGSRSTPLVLALAGEPGIKVYTHLDERSCAFFALGHAKATGEPVALLCTSGSAAANFFPAIVEAGQAEVPLIVLTADRPPELRDTGAGQAIDQVKLYGDAVRWFVEVGTPEMTPAALAHLRGLAVRAVQRAAGPPAGAVHLNFPFRKPLEPTLVAGDVPAGLEEAPPPALPRAAKPRLAPPPEAVSRVASLVGASPRGLILCGPQLGPDGGAAANGAAGGGGTANWPEAVALLARRTGYPILAEPPSQVRSGPHDTSRVVAHGDAILRAEGFRTRLAPQMVLRFGGTPTAAAVETLLTENPACPVVLVNGGGRWLSPTPNPVELIQADPAAFCRELAEALPPGGPAQGDAWGTAWMEAGALAAETVAGLFKDSGPEGLAEAWFEGRVFAELAALLPEGALQYTASSMPVRDLDAFSPVGPRAVRHLVNRGANGIDGTLSSAFGAAAAWAGRDAGPALLVTGDLAFLHDSNGLAAARQGPGLTIILINNGGGGIFEFLPIAEYGGAYQEHFVTPAAVDFKTLAAAHGIPLERPRAWAEFRAQVGRSLGQPGTRVIEVVTDRAANRRQHQQVWAAVAARLAEAFPPGRPIG